MSDARATLAAIERLCAEMEAEADPRTLARSRALVAAVLELHRSGLERALALVGEDVAARLGDDAAVAALLLLHALHPRSLEERARAALGEGAQLVSVADGVVNVRCAAGARARLEAALGEAIPDAAAILVDELAAAGALVPVERLRRTPGVRQ